VALLLYFEGPFHHNALKRRLGLRKANTLDRVLDALVAQDLVWREPLGKFVIYHPDKARLGPWLALARQRLNENEEKSRRSFNRRFEKLGFSDNPKLVSFLRKRVVPAGEDPRSMPKTGI